MTFQSTVAAVQGFGVPGELFTDSPSRVQPGLTNSADASYNVMGRAFTLDSQGVFKAGGTGVFSGLLCGPKEQANLGVAGNTLGATLTIPNGVVAEFCTMGEIITTLPAAANIGDLVYYDNTTGALGTVAPSSSFTGVVATNTLTVTGFVTGGAPLGVGTVISGTGVDAGTVITALGSGTGGNGTYTVNGQATVASTTMTGSAIAPSGKTFIKRAEVWRYTVTGAGLAVVKLTD